MYYHLRDHIYLAQFREELILLDTQKDKYTVVYKKYTSLLNSIIKETVCAKKNKIHSFRDPLINQHAKNFIDSLVNEDILETKKHLYPFYIDRKLISEGVSNVDWRLPIENSNIEFNANTLKALFILLKVNFYIKTKGLYSVIQLLKRAYNPENEYVIPQDDNLKCLANIVNKACLLYPTRTKCLEWAMTFVLLALKRGWKCNLEIGVQNYPFFAHAWVECDGKVVMDSQDLKEGMAIILNEPFRKVIA